MSLLKEKEKAPALTVRADMAKALLAKKNLQEPSPIRKFWGQAKKIASWVQRHPGLTLLGLGAPFLPWFGPAYAAGFGLAAGLTTAHEADEARKKRRSQTLPAACSIVCMALFTVGALTTMGFLFADHAAIKEQRDALVKTLQGEIQTQFAAGQKELTATKKVMGQARTPFAWTPQSEEIEVTLLANAAEARVIDELTICQNRERTALDKGLFALPTTDCAITVNREDDGSVMIVNKFNGARKPGLVLEKNGQTYALPMTVK